MTHTLFNAWPGLKKKLPVMSFADLPTPVQPFASDSNEETGNLWIKRDDLTNDCYGGNKVRKLEFILADAKRKNKHTLVTMGAIGTNHGVATAIFGKKNNFRSRIFLFDQPVSETVKNNLNAMAAFGAELRHTKSILKTALAYYASHLWPVGKYHLPAGGSNIMGCIGFVNAALELKQQIDAGDMPVPETIICPVGSSGTLAGLTLGCQLAGLETQVIGIRVAPSHLGPVPICTAGTAQSLMKETYRYLRKLDKTIPEIQLNRIVLDDDYYGDGYGCSSEAGNRARSAFSNAGIELESTYTAKAAAAVLDQCQQNPSSVMLYWHTFNSAELKPDSSPEMVHLPDHLKKLIQEA